MKSGSTSSLVHHLQARPLLAEVIGALAVIAGLAWVPAHADFLPCMGPAGTTCMTFVNHTNMNLYYTVDGKPVASIPAGEEGSRVVPMGSHTIAAQQGAYGSTVSSKAVSFGKGPSSWTLSGGGPGPSGACLTDEQCAQPGNEGVNTLVSSELAGDFYAGNNLAFKPGSSIPLTFHPTQPLPANTTCTPVYNTVTTYSAEGGVRKVPARIVGNHLVFGPDTGEFSVQGHCLENPKIVSAPVKYQTSLNPDAINTGEAFAESLRPAAVPNDNSSTETTQSNAPASTESSGGISSSALLIGGIVAGAAVLAVAAGAAAKSNSSGQSGNSCTTSQMAAAACQQEFSQGASRCDFCVTQSCGCPSGYKEDPTFTQPSTLYCAAGTYQGSDSNPGFACEPNTQNP